MLERCGKLPSVVLGREFSGVVVDTDPSCKKFKAGDEVFGLVNPFPRTGPRGALTDHLAVKEEQVAIKPENLSFARAACLPWTTLSLLFGFKVLNVDKDDIL